jgi:FkbM family methyltransferase
MKELLLKSGIKFDEAGFIKIPDWVKRVKIDIGLSDGAPQSAKWLEQENDLMVFGFEPNSNNCLSIKKRDSLWSTTIHPNHINKKFFLIECALANVKEMKLSKFYNTSNDPGCSSLLEPKEFEVGTVSEVQTWSLNHFFEYFPFNKIPFVDFIKTDCQGSDIDVIRGCSQYMNRVAIFTCEADDTRYHQSFNTMEEIKKEFTKFGFVLYKNYMKNLSKIIGPRLKYIDTEDPTFINRKLRNDIALNKIRAYQKG